ncbi:hypothetical protein FRC02_011972 [Tulasnella sp. 418]|nr:hypothetical protein FRC02_011972 [Tulasnella sp. 418]
MIATVAGRLQHYFSPENQWETFCNLIRVVLRIHQLRMELPRFDLEWSFTSRDLHDNREPNPVVFVVPRRSIPQETGFRDSEISADPGRLSSS